MRVVAVRFEGFLCKEEKEKTLSASQNLLSAPPLTENINEVKNYYRSDTNSFIVVYISRRRRELLPAMAKWLEKYEVPYHALSEFRPPANIHLPKDNTKDRWIPARYLNKER